MCQVDFANKQQRDHRPCVHQVVVVMSSLCFVLLLHGIEDWHIEVDAVHEKSFMQEHPFVSVAFHYPKQIQVTNRPSH